MRMRELAAGERPVGLDVRIDAEVVVPDVVTAEAAAAAAALVALSPNPGGSLGWADYHRRFLDRYGIGAIVPVAELLHPDRGLGYPAGFRGSRWPVPPGRRAGQREEVLLGLAHDAAWARRREVVLTDRDLVDLATSREPMDRMGAPHTELRAELHAASGRAVDAGAFRLVVLGASRGVGTLTGRFLDLLDADDRARVARAFAGLPTVSRGAATAQVSGPPVAPRTANIARCPQVLPDHIVVAACEEVGEGRIALADLAVSVDTVGLYLLSRSRRVVVEPMLLSAVELVAAAHPTVRFLAEIATARTTSCAGFTWGVAARSMRHLPRLRYGRSVLAPARWTVPAADLPAAATSRDRWEAWRERWEVPDRVLLGQDDRRLPLDLSVAAHRHVLLDALGRRGRVVLTEAPDADAFGWIEGRAHELVLPLASTTAPQHPPRPRPTGCAAGPDESHLPGSGYWLDARLPGHPDRQTAVLTEHLPVLLDALTADLGGPPEWWFVRHTDPEPHLRLRVRLPRPAAFAVAAASIAGWAGQLSRSGLLAGLRFDTYRPETGRYGAGPALSAAETLFAADSAAAVAQLRLPDPDVVRAATAASMLDLVTSFTGLDKGMRWILDRTPRAVPTPPDRAVRERTVTLTGPAGRRDLAATPGGDLVLTAWARRRAALTTYRAALTDGGVTDPDIVLPDLLHLHHTRAVGPSLDGEQACLHLARAAALALLARSRGAA